MSAGSGCPKCGAEMVQGFVQVWSGMNLLVSSWIEGPPKTNWLGAQAPLPAEEKRIPVAVFRCAGCGYLESYAGPEFAAK